MTARTRATGGPAFALLLTAATGALVAAAGCFMRWATVRTPAVLPVSLSVSIDGFDAGRRGGLLLTLALVAGFVAAIGAFSGARAIAGPAVRSLVACSCW